MIVNREKEQGIISRLYKSKSSEFLAVYGRRRVGKTYLIREEFSNKPAKFFYVVGKFNRGFEAQLTLFTEALSETFFDGAPIATPSTWHDAFKLLHQQILKTKSKVVVFLDELPWMATPKAGLLETIDYYWNRNWQQLNNVILVVCGSSASWIIKKIINDKGGLHGRVTCKLKIKPFNLKETKTYLKYRKVKMNDRQIADLYMALGGIPYYLNYVSAGITSEQNIQQLLFDSEAPLRSEFEQLFRSLYKDADPFIELIKLVAKKRQGLLRSEIKDKSKLSSGGGLLSERLQDLCAAGFIEQNVSWGKTKGEYYQVVDEFCLFYLHWLDMHKTKKFLNTYWQSQSMMPAYRSWSGYAYEALCKKHLEQIVNKLGIRLGGVVSGWRYISRKSTDDGAQIDLLVERNDNAITVCEIKYNTHPFKIDKHYANELLKKIEIFRKHSKTHKEVYLSMITANGLKETMYSEELISGVVALKDLFE